MGDVTDVTTLPTTTAPLREVGALIRGARQGKGLTQSQLAERVGTSQSAINRIEQGGQNMSLDLLSRISAALDSEIVTFGDTRKGSHLRVQGGAKLHGSIEVKSSKNGAVALLCAALMNRGTTRLHRVARIVEVDRIIDVLRSLGVQVTWSADGNDVEIKVPEKVKLDAIDEEAGRRTRSVLMFLGPLLGRFTEFELPYAGGCDLGTRTVEPHLIALRPFGLEVEAGAGWYHAKVTPKSDEQITVILTERGDTVTENAIMAAAVRDGVTVIRNASPNYMVQDLCFYLQLLGIEVEGIGSTTLRITGKTHIDADVDYWPGEDPVEAMSLLTAGIVTNSEITVTRVPIEFMEIELATLSEMGLKYTITPEYLAKNERTRLVDVTVHPSELRAPIDKIHPMPFPGLNIDNLPFFAVIAACATGDTLIHDWVYEGRAIHLTDLTRLGANVRLRDPHRLDISGPTHWSGAEVSCPPALRPAVVILLAMLAAKGTSVLRNVDIIARGYEQLQERLISLGASIESFRD
ncbi:helix-turn-helix domain-containing protein [Labedella endophytica]|uniref:UDP-N-acetylglucosamine 1-carboxyvinyltransferase n=1 Tax=Labedella endophytica TaxID=1523160 RepID=A0A3S0VTL8_9MICO|nr:UDP-N-acetylglucosamine 1-carboxyvinyltransferase [Labedella endophytica]RUR01051.1 UDP-N-acetylglucosamine 1-carboxyvinyltransferase [Labedella endophytica]